MIVTIDGPAGSGKSSAARQLAERLGFQFLDTGAMYRAVAFAGKQQNVDWEAFEELAKIAENCQIELTQDRVFLNGQDVTQEIRTVEITQLTKYAADNTQVRQILVEAQRKFADGRNVVAEGRDQATVVFPQAECKIFLTADEIVRAERRFLDLVSRGEQVTIESVLANQRVRDQQDEERRIGGLRKASDSVEIHTNGMPPEEVVQRLEALVRERMQG